VNTTLLTASILSHVPLNVEPSSNFGRHGGPSSSCDHDLSNSIRLIRKDRVVPEIFLDPTADAQLPYSI